LERLISKQGFLSLENCWCPTPTQPVFIAVKRNFRIF
jgi:hypothetical protein